MQPATLRIATRQSPLALVQAHQVRNMLLSHWPKLSIELIPMTTSGDKFLRDAVSTAGGKGLFVKELEEALLDGRADIAVHSMKDVPALFPEDLGIAAILKRHNPFDAFISMTHMYLDTLPTGATIGTVSLRRQSQLLAYRPDLKMKSLRGNVQTRLNKLESGEYDAIILAVAGLERLKMQAMITKVIQPEIMLPACGQGALGIECRMNDENIRKIISPLNDPHSALCVNTERRVNALLGGNCHVPIAVYCCIDLENALLLRAKVAKADGSIIISNQQRGLLENATQLADQCVHELLAQGAAALLDDSSS